MDYYTYLIASHNLTYIGITNNIDKRIKMHNGELKGGAKATRRYHDWRLIKLVGPMSKIDAAKLEYNWKHINKRRTPPGIDNKLKRLTELLG